MSNKRSRRCERRALVLGPEKAVLSFTKEEAMLECGHIVRDLLDKKMYIGKPYRCIKCLPVD